MLKVLFFISCGNIKFLLNCRKKKDMKMDSSLHCAFKFLLVPDPLCPGHLYEIFAWNLYWLDRRTRLNYYSFLFDALYGTVVKSFILFCWDIEEKMWLVPQTKTLNMCFCENFIMPGMWEGTDRNGTNAMETLGVTTTYMCNYTITLLEKSLFDWFIKTSCSTFIHCPYFSICY